MFPTHSRSGFYHANICKALMSTVGLLSISLTIPLVTYSKYFRYTYDDVFVNLQVWRLFTSKLAFLDPKDLVCGALLFYHFRVFERKYGSRKFSSYLLATGAMATLLEVAALYICHKLELDIVRLPTGPHCIVFPLYIPFFYDIPRVAVTTIFAIPVTGKTLTYIFGLQIASTSLESLIVAVCGLVSGILYRKNFLKIQSWLLMPSFVARICDSTLGALFESSGPDTTASMGATLEIQRQQEIERLEQQMALAQFREMRQRHGNGRINNRGWGLFGSATGNQAPVVSEEQVQRLIDMGFARENVVQALRATNNDVTMATNILLTQM